MWILWITAERQPFLERMANRWFLVIFLKSSYIRLIKHTFYYIYISNQILSARIAIHYILNHHMSIFPCFCGKCIFLVYIASRCLIFVHFTNIMSWFSIKHSKPRHYCGKRGACEEIKKINKAVW